ncbi:hypothetical protein [Burkholderia ubonensis]|uniref:Uncharacterized protein n=1 Tax=Burkholderia ubonensis subsp. mesacidophila TaxID=265293 RepID=A0A2A4FBG5_9BURK|nr:hypothetical protein [Burkholderia ubonensis]PCE30485.1 hypothetical protein BZL54_20620 [Burkholderia ubonensis subsp. mesacidophila]
MMSQSWIAVLGAFAKISPIPTNPHFAPHKDMRHTRLLLALLTCATCLITPPAFAQNADMTEEELSRMTGIDPLWVHITPCLANSMFEQGLARQRADGVTLNQLRAQLADQMASNPEIDGIIVRFYGIKEAAIPDEVRQRHDACVAKIVGAPVQRVDACYVRNYAPYLQILFGAHPQAADQLGTRTAYIACLKASKGE